MPIKILPDEIASQIAAGEVVERPASVVKELLENALDAGAKHIEITIDDAGQRVIEVADNGCGIPAKEMELAVIRHATSKLSTAEDLFKINTLGFRGEALASIGSVSRMSITSRTKDTGQGLELQVDAGKIIKTLHLGMPVGTVVRVEDLFYNVPARLKFLKTERTERRAIDLLVMRYALAYPDVRIQMRHGTRQVLNTSGKGDRREILANLFDVETARAMIEVLAQFDNLKITGFVSPISITRATRRDIIFFINGRPVQDFNLTTALTKAYHTMLMVGRFPIAVIFLEIPADKVDVNVHPTKAEVRFQDRDIIFRLIGRAVRRALSANTPIPKFDALSEQLYWGKTSSGKDFPTRGLDPAWGMAAESHFIDTVDQKPAFEDSQADLPNVDIPLLRLVGQVARTYLIAEGPDGLYLIDQHAAHERVLFEKFMAQRSDKVPSQQLLEPVVVEFPSSSAEILKEQIPVLLKYGFEVEDFGQGSFLVRALPTLLIEMNPAAALRVLVEDFEDDETPLEGRTEAKIIARICKRASVKGGEVLSLNEQSVLLRDLEACQSPRTCPHGRPTMIHLSAHLLERQFGRRGAR
ncbi:MAG: DNA mismatch repair endonuclease MutL [Chloroflexi bacterium]|nr:DNA mismatch repair endonuclease MutL [Chloroflexota bacterium]